MRLSLFLPTSRKRRNVDQKPRLGRYTGDKLQGIMLFLGQPQHALGTTDRYWFRRHSAPRGIKIGCFSLKHAAAPCPARWFSLSLRHSTICLTLTTSKRTLSIRCLCNAFTALSTQPFQSLGLSIVFVALQWPRPSNTGTPGCIGGLDLDSDISTTLATPSPGHSCTPVQW